MEPPVRVPVAPPSDSDVSAASIVEAILFATDTPLPAAKIAEIAGDGNAREVKKHIAALNETYAQRGAAFRIEEIAGGFQMLTLPVYNDRLSKLLQARRETRLSQAALETLAIVAYKQPILRADVEAIRGVAAGEVLNRLRELNLVKIVGRAEEIGRPLLYGTTKKFLDVFGLGSLDDLPKDQELAQPDS
ncbi:MAG: SMC-Scp complex subunit ScpB [Planctomycetes bacterium]|nr:SMC-Scp complex subunit ScpB [Planctomycetota bacterium]